MQIKDEEELLQLLSGASKENRSGIMHNFLKQDSRYRDSRYTYLKYVHVTQNQMKILQRQGSTIDRQNKNLIGLETELEMLREERSRLMADIEAAKNQITQLTLENKKFSQSMEQSKLMLQETSASWTDIQNELEIFNDFRGRIEDYIADDKILFVSGYEVYMPALLLGRDVIQIDQASNWGKTKWSKYQAHKVFIVRHSITSSSDWMRLQNLLNELQIEFIELKGYEELEHLTQVVDYFIEEDSESYVNS